MGASMMVRAVVVVLEGQISESSKDEVNQGAVQEIRYNLMNSTVGTL